MKPVDYSRFFNPLFLLMAGVLGAGIILILFSPYFGIDCQNSANAFFCGPEFSIWFFLLIVLWGMITVFFLPGWEIFRWLFKSHIAEKDRRQRPWEISKLLVITVILAISTSSVSPIVSLFHPAFLNEWNALVPTGVERIINITVACFFLLVLPYVFGMLLVNLIVREIATRIQNMKYPQKNQFLVIVNDLLMYRKILQLLLIISAILLSMIPLTSIALRAVLVTIQPEFANIFPVAYDLFWGLQYTLLLLIFYVPAQLELSIVGGQLRDVLIPLDSVDTLKDTMEKRKALDDLLQTNFSLTTALRSGIATLGPLISSLFGLLGIKL